MADGVAPVVVTSRVDAARRLTDAVECARIGCVVSIGDPGQAQPEGFSAVHRRLRLEFHDVSEDGPRETAPAREDVLALIELARAHASVRRTFLVHCEAGISRSPAAAIVLRAAWLGPHRCEEAVRGVIESVPWAFPNARIIALGDELLGCGGRLMSAVKDAIARRP
jgi:predicted protein tyrosine phosphatase